jgi:TldD protein
MGPMTASLFLERRRAEALVFDDGRVKTASYDASEGFGLRAVNGRPRAMRIPPRSARPR